VNWNNLETVCLINPKWPRQDQERLLTLSQKFNLKNHVWIASSGSSSENFQSVKLIALSQQAFLASAQAVNQHLEVQRKDIWIQVLPRFHVGGLSIEARSFLSQSQVVPGLLKDGKWSPTHFNEKIQESQASLSALVPTQVYDLVQLKIKAPRSMRAIVVGGSALSSEIYDQALKLGWPLLPSYGMTECCSQIATASLHQIHSLDSSMRILSHVQVALSSEGFLKLKSEALLTGYAQWKEGEAFWVDPKVNGWLTTEDLAEIQGGELRPLGRGMEYIKISGEGVQLGQLQQKLENIIQVEMNLKPHNFAVFALADERTENKICLAAVAATEPEIQKLLKVFNSQVAPYEGIKQVFSMTEIPRTDLGKIARKKIHSIISAREKL
jgi:O-succinylbenzoic acid--CoA ligase